jgi:hypothetical protein
MVQRTCGTIEIVNFDSFLYIVNPARKDSILVTLIHEGKSVRRMKKFTWVTTIGTTLPKWEPMGLKYSKF